jgi:drug/metabolite transporter (DMT)-like permease
MAQPKPAAGPPPAVIPYAAGLGAILLWSSLAAALFRSLGSIAPQQILSYGMGIAGVALLTWDWIRGNAPWRTWPGFRSILLGGYGIFGYHALLVGAFALAPPIQANVLNYTWPLWIIVLGTLHSGQRLTPRIALGGLVGLAGTVLALEPWRDVLHTDARSWIGYGLALGAGFCWGSFTILLRRSNAGERAMGWWCLEAALISCAWMLLAGVPVRIDLPALLALAYIGLLPLGAAFGLWGLATRHMALQKLGLLSYLTPPLSTLLLGWVSAQPATLWAWLGLALVLGGAFIGGTNRRRA